MSDEHLDDEETQEHLQDPTDEDGPDVEEDEE
jgi:hypothetical protein